MNTQTPLKADQQASSQGGDGPHRFMRWHRRVLGFCLVIFAMELGLFLVVFPWRPEWEFNWVPVTFPRLFKLWNNSYIRGLVSGLGLLDVYVALAELYRQLKSLFASHSS